MGNRRRPANQRQQGSGHAPDSESYLIGYVHPGQVSAYFLQSLVGTLLYDRTARRRVAGILNDWSSANISSSRNKIVAQFLDEHTAEWLLFIDSDMAWDVQAPDELLAVADPEHAPIVGGLCFGSAEDQLFPTIYAMGELEDGQPITMRLRNFPDDTLVRCAATGAAFLLIHRGVLEQMRAAQMNPAFPWFQETAMAGQPCSEDITFCLRAGMLGRPVHVHTGIHIGHHKTHVLTHEKFRTQTPAEEVPQT